VSFSVIFLGGCYICWMCDASVQLQTPSRGPSTYLPRKSSRITRQTICCCFRGPFQLADTDTDTDTSAHRPFFPQCIATLYQHHHHYDPPPRIIIINRVASSALLGFCTCCNCITVGGFCYILAYVCCIFCICVRYLCICICNRLVDPRALLSLYLCHRQFSKA